MGFCKDLEDMTERLNKKIRQRRPAGPRQCAILACGPGSSCRQAGAEAKEEVAEEGNADPGGHRRHAGVHEGQRAEDAGRDGGGGQLRGQSPGEAAPRVQRCGACVPCVRRCGACAPCVRRCGA
ncbi:unnamed protein product [Rangifer tarandus platyrhynchus]|uniref:Uncharacterized protein n=2 Tax=Rangifer tarandus platyrhynchus TaxID=3082113 RepID=A0AC60A6V5_RANTA|nr:unnamed protein product [Rangifer tarandus platyrhynchus]